MKKVLIMNLTPRMWMLHYSAQFSNELAKTHNVYVAIASYYKWDMYDDNIKLLKIRTNPTLLSFIFDTLNIFQHIYFILRIIFFVKPNIIHFIDNHPRYIFYGYFFKILWYTIYVTQHDPILHSWERNNILWKVSKIINKVLRNISNKLIVHWDNLKNDVISSFNISHKKIISVPHGNYNFFCKREKNILPIKNSFLFFWRIVDYKWLDILLESLEYVIKKKLDFFIIIAWSWNIEKYDKLIQKYNNNIKLYNQDILEENFYKYFKTCEFVVLPYKDATWSWVIPVAYAFSKAVLVTYVWELATNVLPFKSWIVVEPNNPKVLAEKIIWMLENKSAVIEMWKRWRKYTEDVLGWDKIVKKIYK